MLQIVYISTARDELDTNALETILSISRRNNRLAGVSGVLIAGGRRFLQALEGPEGAVLTTMERIRKDPRHFAIVELSRAQVVERGFGDWEMAYQTGGSASAGADLAVAVESIVAPVIDRTLRAQFTSFAKLHAKAA